MLFPDKFWLSLILTPPQGQSDFFSIFSALSVRFVMLSLNREQELVSFRLSRVSIQGEINEGM